MTRKKAMVVAAVVASVFYLAVNLLFHILGYLASA